MLARWFLVVVSMLRAPVARRLWLLVAMLGLYSFAIVTLEEDVRERLHGKFGLGPQMHAVLGLVLGMLLGFRNNTAYDRWWEGRKLWGQLVNESRNLIIKVRGLNKVEQGEVQHVGRLLINFSRALREHLREGVGPEHISVHRLLPTQSRHVPMHLAYLIREQIVQWRAAGKIDGFDELVLDVHSRALMDVCGACERIRKTPLAHSYLAFIRQLIALYVITLPWGLADDFEYWTIPLVMLASYFMIGIEIIAEDVGEPFGRELDDLRLEEICKGIEDSVTEIVEMPARTADRPLETSAGRAL